jgi:hypothetical protein
MGARADSTTMKVGMRERRRPLVSGWATFALGTLLAALQARAECKPAAPGVVAEAERQAGDAEHKADQARSVAVRSGNPGAARRADQARREAVEARRHAAELACQAPPAASRPAPKPAPGY